MMTQHARKIRFYKDCYAAGNREQAVWNILSKQNENLRFIDEQAVQELQRNGQLILPAEYGGPLENQVRTYRREKSLILVSDFVVGKTADGTLAQRGKVVRAPLSIFEAEVTLEQEVKLSVDWGEHRWNPAALSLLFGAGEGVPVMDTLRTAGVSPVIHLNLAALAEKVAEVREFSLISKVITDYCSAKELKNIYRSGNGVVLCRGAAILVVTRSRASRGFIDELDFISEQSAVSEPLRIILGGDASPVEAYSNNPVSGDAISGERSSIQPDQESRVKTVQVAVKPAQLNNVPGLLSRAQQSALQNAASKTLSIIIGPPGTGKSYTIACIALERFLHGESVLIVSSNEHAVDVVQEKLIDQLGISANAVLRAGNHDYHRQLKRYLDDITRGVALEEPGPSNAPQLAELQRQITRLEQQFQHSSQRAVRDGVYASLAMEAGNKAGFWQRLVIWWIKKRWRQAGYLYDQLNTIQELHRQREALLASQISHVYSTGLRQTLDKHRKELVTFLGGLKARTSQRQENLFGEVDYQVLLGALPVWCCSLAGLHKALPVIPGLFDLVIIDESTQCDIASSLPALNRAKRAVVVGDPRQLRHVSFLSREKEQSVMAKHQLEGASVASYRDDSLIDLANQMVTSQKDVVMLDEHYRSVPALIRFSNARFYQNRLRVMTEKPSHQLFRSLVTENVKGGKREDGINHEESQAVLAWTQRLIEQQRDVAEEYVLSVGVLSFFREQADYLQQRLLENFDLPTLARHSLRAATPYGFQGEERDVMLISCTVDNETSGMTYRYLDREDVFNVAVTRARELQVLFISASPDRIPGGSLLGQYLLEASQTELPVTSSGTENREKYLVEIEHVLAALGVSLMKNYTVAGVTLDLVACDQLHSVAIDLIGFPGEHEDVLHLDRYKIFERSGLTLFPLSYLAWKFNRNEVLERLRTIFDLLRNKEQAINRMELISAHWHKLLVHDVKLARRIRLLELDPRLAEEEQVQQQIRKLVDGYRNLMDILGQKLDSQELTFMRYSGAARQVVESCLDNLSSFALMQKSLASSQYTESDGFFDNSLLPRSSVSQHHLVHTMDGLKSYNQQAIDLLEEMAAKWAGLTTSQDTMQGTLTEIERLNDMIQHYSASD